VVNPAGVQGRRSILPREISVASGRRTERVVRLVIAAEKSADGVIGGTSFAEGLNAGKTLECGTLELVMRLKTHRWPSEQRERVKPGRRCSKEPKPARRSPLLEPLARTQNKPFVLNPANRRIRTRMYGGVGGRSREAPPIPIATILLRYDRRRNRHIPARSRPGQASPILKSFATRRRCWPPFHARYLPATER